MDNVTSSTAARRAKHERSRRHDTARDTPETRPRAYAALELVLDLLYLGRTAAPMDYDGLVIVHVVNEAVMRPLLVGPNAPLEIMDNAYPDDEARGSISRLMIAERRGLARETVRRKVNKLIKSGMLYETEDGRARPIRDLSNPPVAARGRRNLQGCGTL